MIFVQYINVLCTIFHSHRSILVFLACLSSATILLGGFDFALQQVPVLINLFSNKNRHDVYMYESSKSARRRNGLHTLRTVYWSTSVFTSSPSHRGPYLVSMISPVSAVSTVATCARQVKVTWLCHGQEQLASVHEAFQSLVR